MGSEIILKKLSQLEGIMKDIEEILFHSFEEFAGNKLFIGAAERYFQLLVDIASDVNVQILVEKGVGPPDTYRQSFSDLAHEGVIGYALAEKLAASAQLRNILVHEYDFEEDYLKFYNAAKEFLPAYREYVEIVYKFVVKQ